ncbi:MAG: hypothetical protein J6C46_01170 [Clostridia bacterium]|nr:hypothetical protein [Clostridia bacterium]
MKLFILNVISFLFLIFCGFKLYKKLKKRFYREDFYSIGFVICSSVLCFTIILNLVCLIDSVVNLIG